MLLQFGCNILNKNVLLFQSKIQKKSRDFYKSLEKLILAFQHISFKLFMEKVLQKYFICTYKSSNQTNNIY